MFCWILLYSHSYFILIKYYRMGDLNNKHLFSHIYFLEAGSPGLSFGLTIPEHFFLAFNDCPHVSSHGLFVGSHSWWCLYVQISSSYKYSNLIRLGPTLRTCFNFITSLKALSSHSHILAHGRLGLHIGKLQSIPYW